MKTGLIRRNGRYSTRRVIPTDLRAHYGRREVVKALGTADPAEANRRHSKAMYELDLEFEAVRRSVAHVPDESPPKAKPPMDWLSRLNRAVSYLREKRDEAAAAGDLENWVHGIRMEQAFNQSVLDGDHPPEGMSMSGHEVMRTAMRAVLTGEGVPEAPPAAQPVAEANPTGPLLLSLIDKWAAERKPAAKTKAKAISIVADFCAEAGQLTVDAITPDHIQSYKERLIASGRTAATNANKLNILRALLRFARRSRLIKIDPCDGIMIEDAGHAKDKRTAYDAASLAAVFGGNVYSADIRPTAGKGEAAYWLPLLSLYTGARLNELGQLRPKDVVQELYLDANEHEVSAWVIRIVEDKADGLRLKTANSERRVPVHSELIGLGFLRYVQASTEHGSKYLFPNLKADKYGNVTAQWSKWYGRYLRETCGVADKRITFHLFRHTFKHLARFSGLAPDVQNEITGHETGDIGDRYGGLNYPLRPLVEGINRYRVPAFTIPAAPPKFRDAITLPTD